MKSIKHVSYALSVGANQLWQYIWRTSMVNWKSVLFVIFKGPITHRHHFNDKHQVIEFHCDERNTNLASLMDWKSIRRTSMGGWDINAPSVITRPLWRKTWRFTLKQCMKQLITCAMTAVIKQAHQEVCHCIRRQSMRVSSKYFGYYIEFSFNPCKIFHGLVGVMIVCIRVARIWIMMMTMVMV